MPLQIGLPEADACYGCGACTNICPKYCIEMITNEYGERKPRVDTTNCIVCGNCMKVCPALRDPDLKKPQKIWALAIKDPEKRKGSASGGAARLLYEQALSQGATVYGCDFNEQHILRMRSARCLDEIEGFRNSKYTYCRMENTYRDIKERLAQGEKILFIGTSCQVDAVLRYVGNDKANLFTVDLLCHGVPPEMYFIEYLEGEEKYFHTKIDKILFRGSNRNRDFYLSLYHKNQKLKDEFARCNIFYAGYVNKLFYQKKCYSCPYSGERRCSDITICDWWGEIGLTDAKASLILVNSDEGNIFLEKIFSRSDVWYEEHSLQDAINSNEQLKGTSEQFSDFVEMREFYKKNGFMKMAEKYVRPHILEYEKKIRNEKIRRIMHLPIRIVKKAMRVVKHI